MAVDKPNSPSRARRELSPAQIEQRREAARSRWRKARDAALATAGAAAAGYGADRAVTAGVQQANRERLSVKRIRDFARFEHEDVEAAKARFAAIRERIQRSEKAIGQRIARDPIAVRLQQLRVLDRSLSAGIRQDDGTTPFIRYREPDSGAIRESHPLHAKANVQLLREEIDHLREAKPITRVKVRRSKRSNSPLVFEHKRRQIRGRMPQKELNRVRRDARLEADLRAVMLRRRALQTALELRQQAYAKTGSRKAGFERFAARVMRAYPSRRARVATAALGGLAGGAATYLAVGKVDGGELAKAAPGGGVGGIAAGLAKAFLSLKERVIELIDRMRAGAEGEDKTYREMVTEALDPLGRPFLGGARRATGDETLAISFDLIEPRVISRFEDYRFKLVRQITEGQAEVLRRTFVTEMAKGSSIETMARRIRDTVGLTAWQAQHVANYRADLSSLDPDIRARTLNRELRDRRYDRSVKRSIAEGRPMDVDKIDAMVEAYQRRYVALRATTIARTESLRAANLGTFAGAKEAAEQYGLDVEKTWIATDDDRTRDAHEELDGKTVQGLDLPFVLKDGRTIRYPHDPEAPADLTINCLLPGARVYAPGLRAVASRPYEGDAITLKTRGGAELSCTINHPILTARGWVAAQFLKEGDRVIRAADGEWRDLVNDGQHAPPRIEDLKDALDRPGAAGLQIVRGVDFHHEGVKSEVGIVTPDRDLLLKLNPSLEHPLAELAFLGDCLVPQAVASRRGCAMPGFGSRPSADSFVGGLHLRLATLLRHLAPLDQLGLTACPRSAAIFSENAGYDAASNAKLIGQALHRATRVIGGDEAAQIWGCPDTTLDPCLGPGAAFVMDELVSIRRQAWAGHVYNLETDTQLYVASGFVQHNCRCSLSTRLIPRMRGDNRFMAERL